MVNSWGLWFGRSDFKAKKALEKISRFFENRNIWNLYLHCTEQPPQYWCYPPLYWIPPQYWCYPLHVLMLSPNVLNTLHSTESSPLCTEQPPQYWCYPPQYWCYPHMYCCYPSTVLKVPSTVLNTLHSIDVIPHSTDVIPLHVLMFSSTVLNNLNSTEAILPQYWCCPPMYWTTSNVLNNLHSTEPTSYGMIGSPLCRAVTTQ